MKIPHPSITGMASGLLIANTLNNGYPSEASPQGHHHADSVLDNIKVGKWDRVLNRFTHNTTELVTKAGGRKVLGEALGIAVIGAGIRKLSGNPKIGGNRLFFRI